jgi:hypothetical protein
MGCTEAEFLDVIGTKSSEFTYVLFTATSAKGFTPPSPSSKCDLKLFCNVNTVNRNLKSENYQVQDYAQKSQRYCMFMSSASV